jgi:hypothetical protein
MYSPEADDVEMDGKFDGEEDDDDDEDSDISIDDDIAPDTNFDLPPPLIVSPLKANPLGGGIPVFGTPPFLERRQAWGGSGLIYLSMNHSAILQQLRPPRKFPVPPPGTKLPPPSSFPVPSSITSRPPPPPPPPPIPVYQEVSEPHHAPDFSSDPESYSDPTIMQAIIASMSPSGMDFNFGHVSWADGGGVEPWQTTGMDPSFPRCSPVLSASSSTLHSALG